MAASLANIRPYWVPLGFDRTLRKRPNAVSKTTVHPKHFATYTNATGELLVMDDACPHRGASLSRGAVKDNCLACAYHDLRFSPLSKPHAFYEHVNLQGVVWLNADRHAASELFLPYAYSEFDDPDYRTIEYSRHLRVNPVLLAENMLDWQHLAHVHRVHITKDARFPEVTVLNTGPDGRAQYVYDLRNGSKLCVENEYHVPFTTSLRFSVDSEKPLFLLWFSLQPIGEADVLLHTRVSRRVGTWPVLDPAFYALNELPLFEDETIVANVYASSWSSNVLTPADEFVQSYRESMLELYPAVLAQFVR